MAERESRSHRSLSDETPRQMATVKERARWVISSKESPTSGRGNEKRTRQERIKLDVCADDG
jgi:hypothetical protein